MIIKENKLSVLSKFLFMILTAGMLCMVPTAARAGEVANAPSGPASDIEKKAEETEAQPEETEAAEAVSPFTDEELFIMAHLLAGEAQNCPDEEQLYVGSVALNRVNHPSFPNTLQEVVFQKGQYSCVRDGNYYREPTQQNWSNARILLEGGSVLPPQVVWQSGGRQGKGVYLKTRWHYYCY